MGIFLKINICQAAVKYVSSTSTLWSHLAIHNIYKSDSDQSKRKRQRSENESVSEEFNREDTSQKLKSKGIRKINEAILIFLISTNQALSLVDNEAFKYLNHVLNSSFKIPSSRFYSRNLVHKMVKIK